jgi:hypothetical protein
MKSKFSKYFYKKFNTSEIFENQIDFWSNFYIKKHLLIKLAIYVWVRNFGWPSAV